MGIFSTVLSKVRAYKKIPPSVIQLCHSVKGFIPYNPVIIEAGAHMGYDTIGLSKAWPKGVVYGFEPIPVLYEALCEKVKSQKNVLTYNFALGESNTTVPMHVSSGLSNASSSILKPSKHLELFPEVSFNNTIEVKMKTLQVWAQEEGIPSIDLMWLDMQGYEVNALKGAGVFLEEVKVIYTELCRDELYHGLTTRDAYIRFLETSGFRLISVVNDDDRVSDGIFVNKKYIR